MPNFGGLDGLNFYANILQIASYQELLEQANNNDILRELNHQNKDYFEQILRRLEAIEEKLEVQNENNKRNINGNS